MGRLDEVLSPDEKVVFRTGLHWLPCCPGAHVVWLAALAIAVALLALAPGPVGQVFSRQPLTGAVLALLLVMAFVLPILGIRYRLATHEFAVTERRVLASMGLVRTRTVDLSVAKVETLVVEQGVLGRLFGYGDVRLVGTGGTAESFHGVRDPIGFRRAVSEAGERAQRQWARP